MMDYEKFKEEVYKISTIDLSAYKEKQMKRRLDALISKHNYDGYEPYVKALRLKGEVYEEFVTYMTINVSEFYRNPPQWKILEEKVLPYLFQKTGSKNIKIWSAACSTGDEPYSLAMLMSKFVPLKQISILATDIDKQILEQAQVGLYAPKSIVGVPADLKAKYLEVVGKSYKISDEIKKCVTFKQHNLLKDPYPKGMDLIVCRNVLIYFTNEAKDEIYHKFNLALKPGGVLFVGSTEQIIGYQKFNFNSEQTFFYKKEGESTFAKA